jgi:hypothetical protein
MLMNLATMCLRSYQPPTLTNTLKEGLIDLIFAVSWKRLDGVEVSMVTISKLFGSIYANAKFTLYE